MFEMKTGTWLFTFENVDGGGSNQYFVWSLMYWFCLCAVGD